MEGILLQKHFCMFINEMWITNKKLEKKVMHMFIVWKYSIHGLRFALLFQNICLVDSKTKTPLSDGQLPRGKY